MREKELWEPVQRLLKMRCRTKTWRDGAGESIGTFQAGSGKGKPDIIGVSKKSEVHFAEGKLLFPSRNKFHETMSQLKDWIDRADYLWAAFDRSSWEAAEGRQRETWKARLHDEGFGLILVQGPVATAALEAEPNLRVKPEKRDEVLERLKLPILADQSRIPSFSMSRSDALDAARAAAWCYDLLDVEARKVARVTRHRPFPSAVIWGDHRAFGWDAWYDKAGRRAISADPFGSYLGDGRPALLVWRWFGSWNRVPRGPVFPGAVLSFFNDQYEDFRNVSFTEAAKEHEQFEAEGFRDVWLVLQIP